MIMISELSQIGFESFQEHDYGFEGSCQVECYEENQVKKIFQEYGETSYYVREQEKINWNEEWEKNYNPIIVEGQCLVRADFHHSNPSCDYEIIVNPKMSFGTGHHATTYQMLAYQINLDHENKKVLEVGCGTGILSIMAARRGASDLVATDIDDWCITNSRENFALNKISNIKLIKGEIENVKKYDFDIILANITKNVLLNELNYYAERLNANGVILMSGFYKKDIRDLQAEGCRYGLKKIFEGDKDNWAILVLENNQNQRNLNV